MWSLLTFILFVPTLVDGKLIGENICREEQIIKINVTEYVERNSTVRQYKWCMNVPPRCSFYTTRLLNHTQIVEKEVTDVAEKCCSGYISNHETNLCEKQCSCTNGKCQEQECICFAGYKGSNCDQECSLLEWGPNCSNQCNCQRGTCNSITGTCNCPSGWNGVNCETPCLNGTFGKDCQSKCECIETETCNHISGACQDATLLTVTTSTSESLFESSSTIVQLQNNGKFVANIKEVVLIDNTKLNKTSKQNTSNDVNANNVILEDSVKQSKEQQEEKPEENYLNDEILIDHSKQKDVDKSDLVNSASAATVVSITIILVAIIIVAASRFKKSKRFGKNTSDKTKTSNGVSTVSVYTHSIFHTPLPDPPLFENPIFVAPIEGCSQNGAEGQRFETKVVCSMQFPSSSKDSKDYLYDHPPSTGSYRAASILDPNDALPSVGSYEPVYDEIPSGMATPISEPPPSYKSCSSLYMNTCAKTRL